MSDRLEATAKLYDEAAKELDQAARHCEVAAAHFRDGVGLWPQPVHAQLATR